MTDKELKHRPIVKIKIYLSTRGVPQIIGLDTDVYDWQDRNHDYIILTTMTCCQKPGSGAFFVAEISILPPSPALGLTSLPYADVKAAMVAYDDLFQHMIDSCREFRILLARVERIERVPVAVLESESFNKKWQPRLGISITDK